MTYYRALALFVVLSPACFCQGGVPEQEDQCTSPGSGGPARQLTIGENDGTGFVAFEHEQPISLLSRGQGGSHVEPSFQLSVLPDDTKEKLCVLVEVENSAVDGSRPESSTIRRLEFTLIGDVYESGFLENQLEVGIGTLFTMDVVVSSDDATAAGSVVVCSDCESMEVDGSVDAGSDATSDTALDTSSDAPDDQDATPDSMLPDTSADSD